MPQRLEPFVDGSIYHVFNRTIDGRNIFKDQSLCLLFSKLLAYYRSAKAKISFSKLKTLEKDRLEGIKRDIKYKKYFRVNILAYCLMPTHFHLLVKQKIENGLQRFVANTVNSLTRYFNLKNKRKGPLFLPKFKSVRIQTDEQLIHVSRYIHLNPYSSEVVNKKEDLINFSWSSLGEYLSSTQQNLIDTTHILSLFGNDKDKYKQFVCSNAEYQKTLEQVKYLDKW